MIYGVVRSMGETPEPLPVADEPLRPANARRLAKQIIETGKAAFSKHALAQLDARGMATGDVENVLRCAKADMPAEFENGSWRYKVFTTRITVVFAFRSSEELVVVSAWRNES